MIRVHIAHDSHVVRDSLAEALALQPDLQVVESSPEGARGLEAVDDSQSDVLLLWVPWRTEPFTEITRYRRAAPGTKIIGLYTHSSVRNQMIAAGADAVVDEGEGLDRLLAVIRQVVPFAD